jgi:stress response protein SCP2
VITLAKTDEPADLAGVKKLVIGASWDASSGNYGGFLGRFKKAVGCDLDLIAIAMRNGQPVRLAGLDSQDPMGNGSLYHTGDEQSGHSSGDDEQVIVDFDKLPSPVDAIVFVAAAFKKGNSFADARNISFKVYDATGGTQQQVADIWPSLLGGKNACAIAKAVKGADGWTFEVLEDFGSIRQDDDQSLMQFAVGK